MEQNRSAGIFSQSEKLLPDIVLLILYFVLLDQLIDWQSRHLALSCTILMLLNIAAMAGGCFSFFSMYADKDEIMSYARRLSPFEGAVAGISTLLAALAFLWWLVPFAGAKSMGVKETGFILGMGAYFVIFMAIVAKAIVYEPGIKMIRSAGFKIANSLITTLFFFFSYGFLLLTMRNWHPHFLLAPYLGIICLTAFYLPLRFFLLLRPPFSKLDYPLFILSFGYMLFRLFV